MQTFLTTALLAGSVLALPTIRDETCTQQGLDVDEWTIKNFDYHADYTFTTPAHQNSWGYVNFELINEVLDYSAQCKAASNQLSDFFYGSVNYNCTQPDGTFSMGSFNFSRPANEVAINQTWPCLEEGSRFWAEGSAKLDLDCKEKKWQNPNWELGQIYSTRIITCANLTTTVPMISKRAIA